MYESKPNGICPVCGQYTLYGSLAGEWCENCGYDTTTDY